MLVLPGDFSTHTGRTYNAPVVQVVIYWPAFGEEDEYYLYLSNVAHTYGGNVYKADIIGAVEYEQTIGQKFNDLKFSVQNVDGFYRDLFNSFTTPQLVQGTVYVYETFMGSASRLEVFRGKLELPKDFSLAKVNLGAKHLISTIIQPFNRVVFSPVCQWAQLGLFKDGAYCNYAGAETTCDGSFTQCAARSMQHRFAGLIQYPHMSGSYYWREKLFWFISKKITQRWESHQNDGLFGTPWGVVYGGDSTYGLRVVCKTLYVRDPGSYAVYFAALGFGEMDELMQPPAFYGTDPTPGGGKPVVINGKLCNDYMLKYGTDGVAGCDAGTGTLQQISYLWCNEPSNAPSTTCTVANGQSLSRLAYLAGAYPSDVKTDESLPEVVAYVKGRRLQAYNSDGTLDGAIFWTNCPVWVFVDMCLNKAYGAGLSTDDMDWASIRTAYDDYLAEGRTFSYHFTEQMPFADAVQFLLDSTLAVMTWTDNKIGLKVLKSTDVAGSFALTEADILEDSTKYWTDGPVERDGNTLEFDVCSVEHDFQNVPVRIRDAAHITAIGKEKKISKKLGGFTDLTNAKTTGSFWMNLAKQSRRADGTKRLVATNKAMVCQPGDIIKVTTTTIDGFSQTSYLVWSVRRVDNNGNRELDLIKWDSGLFTLDGISYDTPLSGINPSLDPVNVTDLAATVAEIGEDKLKITVTWTWSDGVAPNPSPAVIYLYAANPSDPLQEAVCWTPQGINKPVSSWQKIIPRAEFEEARIFAVAQSKFRRPEKPIPRFIFDTTNYTTLNEDVDTTEYVLTCTDASDLNASVGDSLIMDWSGAQEIVKYLSESGEDVTVANNSTNRLSYFGTTAQAHRSGQTISKLAYNAPYYDLVLIDHVQSISYVRAYDSATDTNLQLNEIRVKIPRVPANGDKPTTAHIQLHASTPFPEPSDIATGADDAELPVSFPDYVLVPTTYDLTGCDNMLFVLTPGTEYKVGRYITSIDTPYSWRGSNWHKLNLAGYVPRQAGTYDWAIWDLWYASCDYATNVTLTDADLDLNSMLYDFKFTVNVAGTFYLRAYLAKDGNISAGVIATDEVGGADTVITTDPVTAHDTAVPSVPTAIRLFQKGAKACVAWEPPASNIATLSGYIVFLTQDEVTGSPGSWNMTSYQYFDVAANVHYREIQVDAWGRWAAGVKAVNEIGESNLGVAYKD